MQGQCPHPACDFKAFFEQAPMSCVVLDPDLVVVAVTDTYLRDTMTRRGDLIGKRVLDAFPANPDDPQQATELANARDSYDRVRRHLVADTVPLHRFDIRRPDSEGGGFDARYWSTVNTPVLGPDNRLAYIIARVQDVTEYVRLEEQQEDAEHLQLHTRQMAGEILARTQELAEANQGLRRLAAIVEQADDAIFTLTGDGVITSWNKGTEHLYGYTQKEVLGKRVTLLAPPGLEDQASELIRETVSTGYVKGLETVRIRKDGTPVDVSLSLSPIRDAAGEVSEIATIARDITARKRAESALAERTRQLEASNKELEQFAYVASHDLQEPLRKVASFCQLLARRYQGKLDEQADQYIAFVIDGAVRMQQLINDLLTFSRVGRLHEQTVDVDCNEVVRQVRADLAVAIEETGAQVVVTGELPIVRGQRTLLVQLFQNLVANAIRFHGSEPPRVEVSAVRSDSGWQFAVADNGIGIEPHYADRIFAVFQRLHTRADYPGTGIGLAVCKKIVEAYGGRIWFDSRPDEGSTFYWTISAEEEP